MSKSLLKGATASALMVASLMTGILAESNKFVWNMTNNPEYLSKYTNCVAFACVLGTLSLVVYISAFISAYYRE